MINPFLQEDLEFIAKKLSPFFNFLKDQKIFITGGTGFFGKWFLETFIYLNEVFNLNIEVFILTRSYRRFKEKFERLATYKKFTFIEGDVKNFEFFKEKFFAVIHMAATSAEETFRGEDELVKFETVVDGTRRVLEFAKRNKVPYFLFTSSGAVYGKHSYPVDENYLIAPPCNDIKSIWGTAKRAAESLVSYYGEKIGIETRIARCFSFLGPYLPLNIHYAVGNFLKDALAGGPIVIKGTGEEVRAYLYAGDLIIWLLTILVQGKKNSVYNVGSNEGVRIKDLAELIRKKAKVEEIKIEKSEVRGSMRFSFYVPSIEKAKKELGLRVFTSLEKAIEKTLEFYKNEDFDK